MYLCVCVTLTGEGRTLSVFFIVLGSIFLPFFTCVTYTERRKNPVLLCLEDREKRVCALGKEKRHGNVTQNDEL